MSTSGFVSGDFDCGIDALSVSEDDPVTAEYRGLRDVDGWQRRDPWGGCADDVPKRVNILSTPTFISTLASFSIASSTPVYTPRLTGLSKTSALTESGKVPPSTDEPGVGETQRFPESVLNMTEEDIVVLEERARKV